MAKAAANLSTFNVKKEAPKVIEQRAEERPRLITKGFRVTPDAAHQFEMLRAELGRSYPKEMGPRLIAEALNLLFAKHGKPQIA